MMGVFAFFTIVLGIPVAVFLIMFRALEGRWPAFLDRRRPTQAVLLVRDMLRAGNGWSSATHAWNGVHHRSNMYIGRNFDGNVDKLEIEGKTVPLRSCDRRCLTKAVKKMLADRQRAEADAALIKWAERIQKDADKVVSIHCNRRA